MLPIASTIHHNNPYFLFYFNNRKLLFLIKITHLFFKYSNIFIFSPRNYHNILQCYEVSDINTINKIKQIPDNIDGILNNLAKDYATNIPD